MRDVSDDIIRDGIVTSQSEDMTETAVSPFSDENYVNINEVFKNPAWLQ